MGKSTEEILRDKLKTDNRYNPFNKNFDYDFIISDVSKILEDKEITLQLDKVASTALNFFHFNIFNEEYVKEVNKLTSKSIYNFNQLINYVIQFGNRDFKIILDSPAEIDSNEIEAFTNYQIKTPFGLADASSLSDTVLDTLNTLVTHLKGFEIKPEANQNEDEEEFLRYLLQVYKFGSIYYSLKTGYERIVWEDGYMRKVDNPELIFVVDFEDVNFLKLYDVGFIRLIRNKIANYYYIKNGLENRPSFANIILQYRQKKIRNCKLEEVSISNGFIKYKLKSFKRKLYDSYFTNFEATIITYYPYLKYEKLPHLRNLNIADLEYMFIEIQKLVNESLNCFIEEKPNEEIEIENSKEYIKNFSFKIYHKDLINFVVRRLRYNKNEVETFIKILTQDINEPINFWKKPLLKINNYYLLLLPNLRSPIMYYLIDEWLEQGGFSLEKRGKNFENYIKENLDIALKRKRFEYKIIVENRFKIKGVEEEIDLILSLKNIILICEVKCIKYSINPRGNGNAISRLKKGVDQINRKSQFLTSNIEYFKDKIPGIENKKIVKAVITNYPSYSGNIINGVPIVDFFLLESYFVLGKLGKGMINLETGEFSEIENNNAYYTNEDEFSDNLEKYLVSPPPITKLSDKMYLSYNDIGFILKNIKIYYPVFNFYS